MQGDGWRTGGSRQTGSVPASMRRSRQADAEALKRIRIGKTALRSLAWDRGLSASAPDTKAIAPQASPFVTPLLASLLFRILGPIWPVLRGTGSVRNRSSIRGIRDRRQAGLAAGLQLRKSRALWRTLLVVHYGPCLCADSVPACFGPRWDSAKFRWKSTFNGMCNRSSDRNAIRVTDPPNRWEVSVSTGGGMQCVGVVLL